MFGEEFGASTSFCPLIGSDLRSYDANGDGYDDLTCHTSTGILTISESHIVEHRRGSSGDQSTDRGSESQGVGENRSQLTTSVEPTMAEVNLGQTMAGVNVEQTTAGDNLDQTMAGNNLEQTTAGEIDLEEGTTESPAEDAEQSGITKNTVVKGPEATYRITSSFFGMASLISYKIPLVNQTVLCYETEDCYSILHSLLLVRKLYFIKWSI